MQLAGREQRMRAPTSVDGAPQPRFLTVREGGGRATITQRGIVLTPLDRPQQSTRLGPLDPDCSDQTALADPDAAAIPKLDAGHSLPGGP